MRSIIFQLTVRFTVYCLLLQTIIPSFAWAAVPTPASPPLIDPTPVDRPASSSVYLPRIYEEVEKPGDQGTTHLRPSVINTSSAAMITASIASLRDLYKDLTQVADSGKCTWSGHNFSFTYSTDDNTLVIGKGLTAHSPIRLKSIAPATLAALLWNQDLISAALFSEKVCSSMP